MRGITLEHSSGIILELYKIQIATFIPYSDHLNGFLSLHFGHYLGQLMTGCNRKLIQSLDYPIGFVLVNNKTTVRYSKSRKNSLTASISTAAVHALRQVLQSRSVSLSASISAAISVATFQQSMLNSLIPIQKKKKATTVLTTFDSSFQGITLSGPICYSLFAM